MEHLSSLQAISAMVAPVVLITSGVLVANGLMATYSFGLEQIRVLKLRRLEGPRDEMLHEIDRQLATLLYRVRRLHITILIIFGGTALLVLSVVSIAAAEAYRSQAFGVLALCLIFAGVVAMLTGLVIVTIAYRTDWRLLMPPGRATVRLASLCVVYISHQLRLVIVTWLLTLFGQVSGAGWSGGGHGRRSMRHGTRHCLTCRLRSPPSCARTRRTCGTAPAWTAGTEPPSGADMGVFAHNLIKISSLAS